MGKIYEIAQEELDRIVFREYGTTRVSISPLFERTNEEDDELSTPLTRALTFPARAIRYKKAKSVMEKYLKNIMSKSVKIIKGFESELDKSIPQIEKKGKDLQKKLDMARKSGDSVESRSIVNQQKTFTKEVEENRQIRVQNLKQSLDSLISNYTNAIHKRIDEPGYVLKVELSERGKGDLKALWEEKTSIIKQKIYEKLIQIINNRNVKGLENLISKLEIEIEEAEDARKSSVYRRREWSRFPQAPIKGDRSSTKNIAKDVVKKAGETTKGEDDKDGKGDENEKGKDKTLSIYKKIKGYIEENLPSGIGEGEDEYYKYSDVKKDDLFDAYIFFDNDAEEIKVMLYDEEADPDIAKPVREKKIETSADIETLLKAIRRGIKIWDARNTIKGETYKKTLKDGLEAFFIQRKKYIKDNYSLSFYEAWKKSEVLDSFSRYVSGKVLDKPMKYPTEKRVLESGKVTLTQANSFLNKFSEIFRKWVAEQKKKRDDKEMGESFVPLDEYKKK